MRRILVVGISGAGKSTLARTLTGELGVPYYEMDALHYIGPDWAVNEDFEARVARIASSPAWIFDSFGYPQVRDLLWEHADTVIWLDYPRRVVMPRVLRRSLRRTLRRERIFGGNRETAAGWFRRDHPAWWAWSQHGARRREIGHRAGDPRFAPLRVIRTTTSKETARWLRSIGTDTP
jgi:adenylate kinase family enzyme